MFPLISFDTKHEYMTGFLFYDRRKENLQHRSKGRVDKKKSKRENKLLRAGFEGRKAGFIGDSAAGSKGAASSKAAPVSAKAS